MRVGVLSLILVFLTIGCAKNEVSNDQISPEAVAADNSATKTAGDQSESEADRTITQKIRQAVVADDSVSTNGRNVKIITVDGVVTLRGPVKNESEKKNIAAKAQEIAGVKNVENQLEIAN